MSRTRGSSGKGDAVSSYGSLTLWYCSVVHPPRILTRGPPRHQFQDLLERIEHVDASGEEAVTTDVSRWFKRAQPPTSGISPIRLPEVALTCEAGGRSPRPRPPFGRCPVLTHVVTSHCRLRS